MSLLFRTAALPALVLTISLCGGCGTANEEGLPKTEKVAKDDTPVFKNYGERQLWQAEQDKKKYAAAGKGAAKTPTK